MIGKRVIILKRPAVLYAALFATGIASGEAPTWAIFGAAGGLSVALCLLLRHWKHGGRQISRSDQLLVLAPLFLLLGFFVFGREKAEYENFRDCFADSMEAGREVLARGKVRHIRQTQTGLRFELEEAEVTAYSGGDRYRPVGTLLVYAEGDFAENGELKDGQSVFLYGKGSEFESAPNPGGFDAGAYYFSIGITGAVHGKTIRITDFSYHRLNQTLVQAKQIVLKSFVTYLGEEGAGVVSSMLLGERAFLSEETQELYRHGGISHILAISGLHVSLLGTTLYELLRKTVLGRNGAIPVACAGVILYGTFVEAGISTKRAVIMFLLLLLAAALGRTYDTLSAMSVSAIVILCDSPGALYTASFQLSFAAAYGTSVLAVLLKKSKREQTPKERAILTARSKRGVWFRIWMKLVEKGKHLFVFGVAVQLVTFPFTVYHFFEYPTYGFFLNPVVVPLMTILLLCGLLAGVGGLFLPWLGHFFSGGACGILWLYETLCRMAERLPFSLLLIGKPALWQMGVYFVILAAALFLWLGGGKSFGISCISANGQGKNGKNIWERGFWGLLLLLPLCLFPVMPARFEAAFLDVGQGDGIVLRERGGAVLLVDGGSTSVQEVGKKRILPYLKAGGIRVIDCALVSHTDSDHISGIKEILEAMPRGSAYRESAAGYNGTPVVRSLVLPLMNEPEEAYLNLIELAEEKNVNVYYLAAGNRLRVGKDIVLSCLAPQENVTYADKNAASMVLHVSYREFDLLLTGDMDAEGERRLLEEGCLDELSIEVLKVAHHGSYTASSEAFIDALQPLVSVISCGVDNRYGHPHRETVKTLLAAESLLFRTDEDGCVTVRAGNRIRVEKYKEEGIPFRKRK